MRGRIRDIPGLIRTAEGRRKITGGIRHRVNPIVRPVAALYRRTILRRTRIIAIVGSLGKTTTRRVLTTLFDDTRRRSNGFTWAMFQIPPSQRHVIFEVGIERPGEMSPRARTLAPDIAVVTSIGSDHQRSMKTLETTRHEKAYMVRAIRRGGVAVLNGDDPNVMWMATQTRARVITYGFGESNDVRATDCKLEWPGGLGFTIHAGGSSVRLQTQFIGRHFALHFLAAAAVAIVEGIPLAEFAARLGSVGPVEGRMNVVRLSNGAALLCDFFKASYESMHSALDALADVPAGRRIVVFGDIDDRPGTPSQTFGVLGERIAGMADKLIVVGKNFRRYRAGAVRAGMASDAIVDAGEFVANAVAALGDLRPADVVLIKGQAEQRLDRIALALEGRDVRCTLVSCGFKNPRCNACSRLERGWDGLAPVT